MHEYPLSLTFKILAFAPEVYIKDARGSEVFYVKQKAFKLKEEIKVFTDSTQTKQVYGIKADRIIDFSARYNFTDAAGKEKGSVKREGMKSLWKASYNVFEGESVVFNIHEENPWVKVGDALFSEIPVVGMFTGYVFHPSYLVKRMGSEDIVMKLKKEQSFLGRIFSIDRLSDKVDELEEEKLLLSLMMMTLLEQHRG